jgi:hypothetical protein
MLLMLLIGGVCKLLIYMNLLNLLMLPHTPLDVEQVRGEP